MSRRIRIAAAALVCAAVPVALTAQSNTDTRAGLKSIHDMTKGYGL